MTPTKRKISPNSHGSSSKTRRMSLEQTTSPKLRPITDNMTRGRSATVTSPSVEKRTKKRASRRLIPGQQLLTGIWGKPQDKNTLWEGVVWGGKLARTIIYVAVPVTPTRHLVWSLSGLIWGRQHLFLTLLKYLSEFTNANGWSLCNWETKFLIIWVQTEEDF